MEFELPSGLRRLFDDATGSWGCKDKTSSFLYANDAYGRLLGLASHVDVVGRTDFDMPGKTVECAPDFQAQDREVMASGKVRRIFDWHPYRDGEWQAHIFSKMPLVSETGEIVGTIFHGEELSQFSDFQILGTLLSQLDDGGTHTPNGRQTSFLLDVADTPEPELSSRMGEVLFFTVRGWSAKRIAKVLSLSPRTVEAHIDTLRHRFQACNRAQLIEAAMAAGYFTRIPETLFNRQLSIMLSSS
ncbi:helix-turn-helix transcriptional regulator [Pandoraea pnomenusa]|uniref:helix-turn-helix transcriptional regulator n=1 Tax=Pandoraea pnomenusa TaxID=93220 RepID=UPI00333FB280